MRHEYDVVVIGGGAGGLFAASVANALGAKTCIIEKTRLGGDCTWFGCMPSKAILKSASVANLFKRRAEFGLKIGGNFNLDTAGVMSHVRDVVKEISTHHPNGVFEKRGINIILGTTQFIDNNTLKVNDENIKFKKCIICTGSHPVILPIEGLKDIDYLTNETVFDLNILPKSLIVLGGGPIGIELSQAMHRLGVKVSVVEMMDTILFREDKDAAAVLEKKLKQEGLDILTSKKAVKFEKINNKVVAVLEDKQGKREEISADKVLVAIGRAPNVEGLDLEKAGVQYTKKGITANAYLQTTSKNIFACGDIVGPYQFSHVAAYQASVCVRNALFNRLAWQKVNYSNIAWATFTEPEVSHLGLTEQEARTKYRDIKVYKSEYGASDRAVTDLEKEGFVKIITDKKGFILGAHIAGAQASEIIQGLVVAKALRQPLLKIASALYIYPTLSELIKKTAAKSLVEQLNNPLVKLALKIFRKR